MPSSQRMAAEGPLLGVFHPCSSPGAGGPQLAGGGGRVGCWGQAVHGLEWDLPLLLGHEKCPSL